LIDDVVFLFSKNIVSISEHDWRISNIPSRLSSSGGFNFVAHCSAFVDHGAPEVSGQKILQCLPL
jgi:hypothetical protein